MPDGKYVVFETQDHINFIIKRFDSLDQAYKYYLEDMLNRTLAKIIDAEVREK